MSQWAIDPAHTEVGFSVRHMMIARVRGRFADASADVVLDSADLSRSSVRATVAVESVDTRNGQRDDHLRSPDFFDAGQFPSITFASTKITRGKGDDVQVAGDLTIKDVTRPVVLTGAVQGPVKDPWGNPRYAFSLEGKLKREDFGLTWNTPLEAGGVLVGSETSNLSIDTELVGQPG